MQVEKGEGISTVEWCDNIFRVVEVLDESPAADAGLKIDDVIVRIDGKDVNGLTLDELSNSIKGKVGSKVKITIKRNDEETIFRCIIYRFILSQSF